jgi:hypothetical protein
MLAVAFLFLLNCLRFSATLFLFLFPNQLCLLAAALFFFLKS